MLPGTALLIRRAVFDRVGLLDDRYFLYWEDNDFCLRADRAGFRGAFCPAAAVHHPYSYASPARGNAARYFMMRNRLTFLCGHSPRWRWPGYWLQALAIASRQVRRQRRDADEAAAAAILAGTWHGVLGRTGGPYNPAERMPRPLASVLLTRNGFVGDLLGRRFRAAVWHALNDRGRGRAGAHGRSRL
jgi:hypothetical protein